MPKSMLLSQGTIPISMVDLTVALVLAFALGLGGALVYRVTHRGLNYERSFLVTLVMTGPVVAVVMMFIGSNLALSLGMVGALSIIRFRTVIKDTRDMIFLFWMIASGLGCGTYNWTVVTVSCAFLGIALLLLCWMNYGRPRHSDYVLVVTGTDRSVVDRVRELVRQAASRSEMRSLDIAEQGWELVMELRCRKAKTWDERKLMDDIQGLPGVSKVSLLAPQLAVPV